MLGVDSSRCDIRYNKEKIIKRPGLKSGQILTEDNLPKLNPIKPILGRKEMVKTILEKINNIPPCYTMYSGKDKSIARKDPVLHPRYPKTNEKK